MRVHWRKCSYRNPKAEAENCPLTLLHSHSWSRGAVKPAKHCLYCLHSICIWTWTLMGKDESITNTPDYNSSVHRSQRQPRHSFQVGCATEVVSVTQEWPEMAPALHCPFRSPWLWPTEGTQTPGLGPILQEPDTQNAGPASQRDMSGVGTRADPSSTWGKMPGLTAELLLAPEVSSLSYHQ